MTLYNLPTRLIGYPATIMQGDPCLFDRWRWLHRYLEGGPLRTLDAGCGSGAFTMYAARRGNEALGLSFDEANNAKARQRAALLKLNNVEFRRADLRQLDQLAEELGQFDQILCMETIEHILNDQKLVRDLAALLKPNGRLLLTTPHKHNKPMRGETISATEDGGHVRWGYTHAEVGALFEAAGLTVVANDFISGWIPQQMNNLMRVIGPVRVGWALTFPLRLFQVVDRPVTNALRWPYYTIGVVGRK